MHGKNCFSEPFIPEFEIGFVTVSRLSFRNLEAKAIRTFLGTTALFNIYRRPVH